MKIPYDHPWTCQIIIAYHRCDKCGLILENRDDYVLEEKRYLKRLTCPRCAHTFTIYWPHAEEPPPYD